MFTWIWFDLPLLFLHQSMLGDRIKNVYGHFINPELTTLLRCSSVRKVFTWHGADAEEENRRDLHLDYFLLITQLCDTFDRRDNKSSSSYDAQKVEAHSTLPLTERRVFDHNLHIPRRTLLRLVLHCLLCVCSLKKTVSVIAARCLLSVITTTSGYWRGLRLDTMLCF